MNDSDQGMEDQRNNTSMEDPTAMTIEFLRARLLSERSVSRTAKQRADELSKRVAELEEQLKTVSLQRKKAEKATADVLAILESQDMSEFSEDYDSSSDQETAHESGKEEESSVNLKVRRNESEDFSGSEHDSCRVSGGRLSWKGGKGTSPSAEGHKGSSMRRQTSLTSTSSSSRHHMGKSCRQIRHRESRSVAGQESKNGSKKVDAQENGVAGTSSKGLTSLPNGGPDCLQSGSQAQEENVSANLDSQRSNTNDSPDLNGYDRGKDMERALEHQAQLIGRYQEMEKAQKEWEDKFRENNNSTPDSCDPGNYSDITEEREEFKAQAHSHARTITPKISQAREVKPFTTELSKTSPISFEQPLDTDTRYLHDQKDNNNLAHISQSQEFEFPMKKGWQRQDNPENFNNPSQGSDHHAHYLASHEAETSGGRNNLYALVPHQETEGLGGVLEALKHARLSLQQKMNTNRLPIAGGAVVESKPSAPTTKAMDSRDIPVGCAGLFRLPTDYPIEAQTQAKTITSGSHLSSSNYYPDARSSYMDSRSVVSADDRFLTRGYMDMRSGVHATQTQKPYFDPRLDMGLPPTNRFPYSSYPDPMVQMSANAGSSRHVPGSTGFGMPLEDQFLSYDDQFRPPSLYRR